MDMFPGTALHDSDRVRYLTLAATFHVRAELATSPDMANGYTKLAQVYQRLAETSPVTTIYQPFYGGLTRSCGRRAIATQARR
jgi:hypothetical protein